MGTQPRNPMANACPECGEPLHSNAPYCPHCGCAVLTKSLREQTDAYVRIRVDRELTNRLSEEERLVSSLADKVEEIVRKRIWRYGGLVAALIGLAGWFGYSSFKDIVGSAHARLDPIVNDAVGRVQQAQRDIRVTTDEVAKTKQQIDDLSREASEQERRLDSQSGEAATKLASLQHSADHANAVAKDYDARVNASIHRLDAQTARVESAVSNQLVARAYPSIDERTFATLDSRPLGKKNPGEIRVVVTLSPGAIHHHLITGDRLTALVNELTEAGYTPLVGSMGLGGAVSMGFGELGTQPGNQSCVVYYNPAFKAKAIQLASIVGKYVALSPNQPILQTFDMSPGDPGATMKQIVDLSGTDADVYLAVPL